MCDYFRPKYSILGQVPETDIYKPLDEYHQVQNCFFFFFLLFKSTENGMENEHWYRNEQHVFSVVTLISY